MKHIESAHQVQVIEWSRWAYKNGLFIEMKSEKGRLTDNQHWFLGNAESVGYKTVVCYSAKEAISEIQQYYEGCCESH